MRKTNCENAQQAILLAYPGEPADAAVRDHLQGCAECRKFAALQKTLMALPMPLPCRPPALEAVRERRARESLRFWRTAFQFAAAAAVLLALALPAFWIGLPRSGAAASGKIAQTDATFPAQSASSLPEIEELPAGETPRIQWNAEELYAAAGNALAMEWDDNALERAMERNWAGQGGDFAWQIDLSEAKRQLGKAVEL